MTGTDYQVRIKQHKEDNPFISQSDLAHDLIVEDILNGNLQPGERIGQEKHATELQMSRSPIREALLRLER